MDRGMWATWYNLPEQGRDEYLAWLHGSYLQQMLKRPGYLWGAHYGSLGNDKIPRRTSGRRHTTTDPAVPKGDRYILLLGAADSNVFGAPLPEEIHAQLPAADRKMLALRDGERVNIFTEAARVEGPESRSYKDGMNLAPGIQMGTFQSAWQDEMEALKWYAQWRMPAMRSRATTRTSSVDRRVHRVLRLRAEKRLGRSFCRGIRIDALHVLLPQFLCSLGYPCALLACFFLPSSGREHLRVTQWRLRSMSC
jgi:hypothetical protein